MLLSLLPLGSWCIMSAMANQSPVYNPQLCNWCLVHIPWREGVRGLNDDSGIVKIGVVSSQLGEREMVGGGGCVRRKVGECRIAGYDRVDKLLDIFDSTDTINIRHELNNAYHPFLPSSWRRTRIAEAKTSHFSTRRGRTACVGKGRPGFHSFCSSDNDGSRRQWQPRAATATTAPVPILITAEAGNDLMIMMCGRGQERGVR